MTDDNFDGLLQRLEELGKRVIGPAADHVDAAALFPEEAVKVIRGENLMGAYVPRKFGGMGLTLTQTCRICEILGRYCASTAMIFAMHQIQVACIVHHVGQVEFLQTFLRRLVDEQLLLASATTEDRVGGDVSNSICSVVKIDDGFQLEKIAPVISYAMEADALLVTARRTPAAPSNDQVLVLLERERCELDQTHGWDTMGFRGTRSFGYRLLGKGGSDQILPEPYAEILAVTMHPFAHMVWGSLWLGIATAAANVARASVRKNMLAQPAAPPLSALRLAELDERLFAMRSGLNATMAEYQSLLDSGCRDDFENYGFTIRVNNVKIICSELVVDIVGRALQIVGISGYRNDSENSLTRHLPGRIRSLPHVNNDRIRVTIRRCRCIESNEWRHLRSAV